MDKKHSIRRRIGSGHCVLVRRGVAAVLVLLLMLGLPGLTPGWAEDAVRITVGASTITVEPRVQGIAFIGLRIVGPDGELAADLHSGGETLQWHLAKGATDGRYTYDVRVGFGQRSSREEEAVSEPASEPWRGSGSVLVRDGAIVDPTLQESALLDRLEDLALAAVNGVMDFLVAPAAAAQTIDTDLQVQGSLCVGIDCTSAESFGFDTIRLKENNLRIAFYDTSTGSFPANNWQFTFNDNNNGGANYFALNDLTGGKTPFSVIAGAKTNSLYISSSGKIGMGTASPSLNLEIADGDSPAIRLHQDGTQWPEYYWDIAGNEINFFVRRNSGNTLPFRIYNDAPDTNLMVRNGRIGINTENPGEDLHIVASSAPAIRLQQSSPAQKWDLGVDGTNSFFSLSDNTATTQPVKVMTGAPDNSLVVSGGKVGINTDDPQQALHVVGNVYVSANLELGSSRTLKQNIRPLELKDAREALTALEPVRYAYKIAPDEETLGFIAEDVPDLVANNSRKSVSPMDLVAVLVKVVQDQQKTIDAQNASITAQKDAIASLSERLDRLEKAAGRQ